MKALLTDPGILNAILSVLAVLVPALWAKIKLSEWYQNRRNELIDACAVHLEHGVNVVYETVVRDIHADLPGDPARPLTKEERESTTAAAYQHAIVTAKEEGIDLAKALGPVMASVMIKQIVAGKKQVPAGVLGMLP